MAVPSHGVDVDHSSTGDGPRPSPARIVSFPPVVGEDPHLLILGSMPSVESLAHGQYYAHPRNYFWPLMAAVLDEELPSEYSERLDMLMRHHVALWDSVESCVREGSLDGDIREELPHDVNGLIAVHPTIRAVAFNGMAAAAMYKRHNGQRSDLVYLTLPSSSPIPTRTMRTLNDRLRVWVGIKEYL